MATIKEMNAEIKTLESKILGLMVKMDSLEPGSPEFTQALVEKMGLCDKQREIKQKLYARKHPNIKTMFNHRGRKG